MQKLGALAAAFMLLAAATSFAQDAKNPAPENKPAENADTAGLPENVLGDPKAPVTIVEYSSLSCPHCAELHKTIFPKLKAEYIDTGKVRYIMREFPTSESGFAAAVVARCLDQSRYFAFIALLFEKQDDWAFQDDALSPLQKFAQQAGMPEAEFNKCLDNKDLQSKILAIRDGGSKKGVTGTPTLFVNGKILKGATYDTIVAAIKPYLGS